MTPEEALEVVSVQVLTGIVYEQLSDEWEMYPEIGEKDWVLVQNQVNSIMPRPVSAKAFREAYELLEDRADREQS